MFWIHPVLQFDEFVLDDDLEDAVELGDIGVQEIQVLLLDLEEVRCLDGFDKKPTRLASMEAADVGNPVALGGKLDVVLRPFFVNCVHSEAAFYHEEIVPTGEALLQNHLPCGAWHGRLSAPFRRRSAAGIFENGQ